MSELWVLKDVGPEWEIERPATVDDLLDAVRSSGIAERVTIEANGWGEPGFTISTRRGIEDGATYLLVGPFVEEEIAV